MAWLCGLTNFTAVNMSSAKRPLQRSIPCKKDACLRNRRLRMYSLTLCIVAVIRCFFRNIYIVRMRFLESCTGYSYELAVLLEILYRMGPAIAHTASESANELIDRIRKRSLVGNSSFYALRHELL